MGRVVSPTPTPLSSGRVVPALVASYDMHGRAVGLFYTQPTGQNNNNDIILILILIIIAFKGAVRDFLQSPRCAASCLQHVRSSGQGAIVCNSRATHPALITCNMSCATWYEGTAQL